MDITSCWTAVYDLFRRDDRTITIVGTGILMFCVVWITSLLYMILDVTGRPRWLLKYKIQQGVNTPVPTGKLLRTCRVVLRNQLLVEVPILYLIYPLQIWSGCTSDPEKLPGLLSVVGHAGVWILVAEIVFYYSHRLIHWGPLYRTIHKQHHEWVAPVGVAAQYCHPLEHAVSNVLSIILGPTLTGGHLLPQWVWYTMALVSTINNHSGYHFPLSSSPEFHDFHHLNFSSNFGTVGVCDWLHGTDKGFKGTVQERRHQTLYSLKSMHDLYPETNSKAK